VLGSGTAHTGSLAEHWITKNPAAPSTLKAGDIVEMTVAGLGTIRNRIVASLYEDVDLGQVQRSNFDH
jgi:2-keto-4-pentenoate hydratase/2-oxohepta-3-ene-1,7-dioic acid hydratase in catechol pathway